MGINWRTIARREAGEIPVTEEAAWAISKMEPIWFPTMPDIPVLPGVVIKPVPDCSGYAATDDGRVLSCLSKYPTKEFPYKKWAEIKATKGARGYWVIALQFHSGRRQIKLHQVILLAFKGKPAANQQGCHWDDNPDNNHIRNLRWGTSKENRADLIRNGRMFDRKGMKHPMTDLTDLDIFAIRKMRSEGKTLKVIGEKFNRSEAMISLISRRKNWKHV